MTSCSRYLMSGILVFGPSCPKPFQGAEAIGTSSPSLPYAVFGHPLSPSLLQGSPDSVLEKPLAQQFGGAIHDSDHHSPAAPPATCPPDQPSVPMSPSGLRPACPLAKAPYEHSPSLDKASSLQSPPAPDCPCDVCLAHPSSCFVHRGKSWAWGDLGPGDLVRD